MKKTDVTREPETLRDKSILADVKSGNKAKGDRAFERLVLNYEKLIWHIARRFFRNSEDAADAFQETVIKLYNGIGGAELSENSTLKGWIGKVTSNACLDELRKKKEQAEPAWDIETVYGYGRSAPSAEDETLARERVREILAAMEGLTDEHRTLIILREMNGFSYADLAAATGVGINTVKSRLSRARESLHALQNSIESRHESSDLNSSEASSNLSPA
ncbi:MAG: sigma-70 family RNA polymerase sigma factor [Defluviitaleaceae bacterium]|nr:sigma-70 family RNA polymerase sigma factor [Defluviitaleaceae bacterium]